MDIRIVFEESKQQTAAYDGEKQIGECQFVADGESQWTITHTGVRPEYGGRGIAKQLVERVIEETQARGVHIVPVCSYAKRVMEN